MVVTCGAHRWRLVDIRTWQGHANVRGLPTRLLWLRSGPFYLAITEVSLVVDILPNAVWGMGGNVGMLNTLCAMHE